MVVASPQTTFKNSQCKFLFLKIFRSFANAEELM